MKQILTGMLALVLLASCTRVEQNEWESGSWVDLTHAFSSEMIVWPTSAEFRLDTVSVGMTEGGYYYESYEFFSPEHGGTHMDAPIHFAEGKRSVDEVQVDRLMGRAAIIDVTDQVEQVRDYQILIKDITLWEQEHGELPEGAIVLFHTGMDQYWPDPEEYMGTALKGEAGVAELSFPGIHPETARWLVENRSINAVGLDTPSLDYGKSTQFETHRILSEQNIPGFENVANLGELPASGAYVIALPMKIENGSGAPVRIVAHISD